MKRKYPFVFEICGLLLFLAVQVGYSDVNLLYNGGFEEVPGWNTYSNWMVWGNARWATQTAFRGTASLAIDDTWLKPHYGGSSQRVSVEPAAYYQVSFYYNRGSGFNAGNREFEVEWFNANHESLSTITHILGLEGNSGIWQYSGEYEVQAPALAAFMEIRFDFSNTEGDAALHIDEVECRRVFPEYGLRNGGFEQPFNGNDRGNWVVEGSASRSDWNASAGRWSLMFPGSWAGASDGLARQRVVVQSGQEYELVFCMIHDNQFQAVDADLMLIWCDAAGGELFTNTLPMDLSGAEDVWHTASRRVCAPEGAVEVTVEVKVSGAGESGACYLDHIHLAPVRSYHTCCDGRILDSSGEPWIPHGIALSGWMFPEAYMWDIDGAGHLNSYSQLRRRIERLAGSREKTDLFWDTYLTNYLTATDMALLAERGCNSVRIPFNYRELSPENNPGAYLEKGFEQLDRVIGWCAQYGMKVILDMHSCPGGQSTVLSGDPEYMYYTWNEDWNGWEERGVAGLWVYDQTYFQRTGRTPESNIQRTVDIWRRIAERYRNEPALLGYELMNEPILPDVSWSNLLRETCIQITDAIRSVDPHHLILVQGDSFATRTDGLFPPWDDQMAVAFHYYWEPVSSNRPIVQEYLALRSEWGVPFWLGETGENSNPWFGEMALLMKQLDIGWNWWGWKKVESDAAVSAGYAIQKTDAMRYALDHFWDETPDPELFYEGMMDLAEQVSTERCRSQPDYFNAIFQEHFLSEAKPFVRHELPGRIAAVDYDSGGA
ncbi:MAG: glycoside hydrolase family 5 protein, partial [Kiritimatiellae bacterium]|nr:glycoside hydrolase family 5 protein [Kiritimatiellia bacterium]